MLRLNHGVAEIRRVLSALEAVEFKWSIQQILDAPEDWLDDILAMKATGELYKRIRATEQGDEE